MEKIFTIQAIVAYLLGAVLILSTCQAKARRINTLFAMLMGLLFVTVGFALLFGVSSLAGYLIAALGILILHFTSKAAPADEYRNNPDKGREQKENDEMSMLLGGVYVTISLLAYFLSLPIAHQVLLAIAGAFLVADFDNERQKQAALRVSVGTALILIAIAPYLLELYVKIFLPPPDLKEFGGFFYIKYS